jgi:hypothetical protein
VLRDAALRVEAGEVHEPGVLALEAGSYDLLAGGPNLVAARPMADL